MQHFIPELLRKTVDLLNMLVHPHGTDDDMSQELSFVRIIIFRELRDLPKLAYIMQQGGRDQQIPVQDGILLRQEFAGPGYKKAVMQQPADKAVMYGFRSAVLLEQLQKLCVVNEEGGKQGVQMRVLNPGDHLHHRICHLLHRIGRHRHIFRHIILPFPGLADPPGGELQLIVEAGHLTLHEDIIMGFEMFDAVVQIPYLGIHGPGFVLKHQIVIRPVRLGLRRHLALAEINTRDILSFSEILNIVH